MRHSIFAVAALLAFGSDALAGEKPLRLQHFSCTIVRFYVAKYSAPAAEAWARSHGATENQIEAARRCLGSAISQTASLTTN